MPLKNGALTPREELFIDAMARTGEVGYSAEKAGFRNVSVAGSQVLARPAVRDAIRREQLARLNNDLLPLAISTLETIMRDPKATERGRLAATAQVLKYTVGAQVDASETKEPHEMSASELTQRIEALRREAADRAKPIVEGEAKPVESEAGTGVFD